LDRSSKKQNEKRRVRESKVEWHVMGIVQKDVEIIFSMKECCESPQGNHRGRHPN
jgi:hypothetical protein